MIDSFIIKKFWELKPDSIPAVYQYHLGSFQKKKKKKEYIVWAPSLTISTEFLGMGHAQQYF